MTPLWSVAEVLAATGGRGAGITDGPLSAVSIDSREVPEGALFVAVRGDTHDGHDFVGSAIDAGAAAALVSGEWYEKSGGSGWMIIVPDTMEALRNLAQAARTRSAAKIVAVTGSAGKTTTKEAIRGVFETLGPTHASIRSFNNHWGVPLMLARLPREARFAVFEIGMNHAGEIRRLVDLVQPHIAVVTTVAAAHLEFFSSITDIARAKAEIFSGLVPGGLAVVNADHDYVHVLRSEARGAGVDRLVTYGFDDAADWRIVSLSETQGGSVAEVVHEGRTMSLPLSVRGRHMAANALAALIAGIEAGGEPERVIAALRGFVPPEGRGQTLRLGPPGTPLLLIDESYNANVASVEAALSIFAGVKPPAGKKTLILGDMLELGPQSATLHAALARSVRNSGADRIWLVGHHVGALADALRAQRGFAAELLHVADADGLRDRVSTALAYGDAVMVKGSNGIRLGALVELIRERFAA